MKRKTCPSSIERKSAFALYIYIFLLKLIAKEEASKEEGDWLEKKRAYERNDVNTMLKRTMLMIPAYDITVENWHKSKESKEKSRNGTDSFQLRAHKRNVYYKNYKRKYWSMLTNLFDMKKSNMFMAKNKKNV